MILDPNTVNFDASVLNAADQLNGGFNFTILFLQTEVVVEEECVRVCLAGVVERGMNVILVLVVFKC